MFLCLFTLFAFSAVTIANVMQVDTRIIGGSDAKLNEILYQVSIQYKENNVHFCGGSILNANYVITAAHCLDGKSPSELQIIAAAVDLDGTRSEHDAEKIIIHEGYDRASWKHDIALLKTDTLFVNSKSMGFVTLPETNSVFRANQRAVVSGWGTLYSNGPSVKILQRADVFIADQEYCKNAYSGTSHSIFDTHICANDPWRGAGTCKGDSGGPLTVNKIFVGIVSWAKSCGLANFPTVYTRVSSYLPWIHENAV